MSKEKRFKINLSFEDALKKAATTKMDPAINIKKLDTWYEIPDASGKTVQFISIAIPEMDVTKFRILVGIGPLGEKYGAEHEQNLLPIILDVDNKSILPIQQKQWSNPIDVPASRKLTVRIETISGSKSQFTTGILTYKFVTK